MLQGDTSFIGQSVRPAWHIPALDGGNGRYLYARCKRIVDVILAAAALALFSPLMLLIALLIKLDSPGPVLFVQERVGCKPRINRRRIAYQPCQFYVYKFRSMRVQADHGLHERFVREFVAARGEQASIGTFKISGDSRLTRVGRVLRKTSLDELPQLLNVLKGDMSLVGPRPVPPYEVALYEEAHYQRLATLPGITGMWQVRGRSRVPFEQMIRMDIEYVQKASLWLDLKILLLTIPAVISGRGAE